MILSECAVFAAMLLSGFLAGALAALLLTLGRGSAVARSICDFLCPIAVGAIYLFSLRLVSSGIFRLYSLAAFIAGILLLAAFLRRFSPALRRLARRIFLPIKSLSESLERKVSARLAPIAAGWRRRREEKRAARQERLAVRKKKRAKTHRNAPGKKRKTPEEKHSRPRRKSHARASERPKRRSLFPSPFGQNH